MTNVLKLTERDGRIVIKEQKENDEKNVKNISCSVNININARVTFSVFNKYNSLCLLSLWGLSSLLCFKLKEIITIQWLY